MKVLAIDHVQVGAKPGSEGEIRRFYGELLGFEEIAKPPRLAARGGVWFNLVSQQFHVGIEAETGVPQARPKAHVAFSVTSLAQLDQILSACHDLTPADQDVPGALHFSCRDPFGNRIEFIQRFRKI